MCVGGGEGKKDSGADDSGGTKAATIGPQPPCLFPAKPQRCSHFPQAQHPPPTHTHTPVFWEPNHTHMTRDNSKHTRSDATKPPSVFTPLRPGGDDGSLVYRSMKAAALSGAGGGERHDIRHSLTNKASVRKGTFFLHFSHLRSSGKRHSLMFRQMW